jgi:hypothetical protein
MSKVFLNMFKNAKVKINLHWQGLLHVKMPVKMPMAERAGALGVLG